MSVALRWLARHQNPDGSWSASGFCRTCSGDGDSSYETGVTSLAILAFLGAGYTQVSRDEVYDDMSPGRSLQFGKVLKKGLQWLIERQDPEGCVGGRGPKYMYNHAIATMALSEAYGMTAAEALRQPAQRAVDFLVAARNPGRGWRYAARCGENDTSVTGWAVLALKSADLSDLSFSPKACSDALAWMNEATSRDGLPRVGYTGPETGKVFIPGKNEEFVDHPTMSAVALVSRIFMEKKRPDPTLTLAITADLPTWAPNAVDFYYWYYASLALFQYDGPKGAAWSKWNEPMKAALLTHQKMKKDGCENGSWDPAADRWGSEGGRVYATAINTLTLEVYYRYANAFGTSIAPK